MRRFWPLLVAPAALLALSLSLSVQAQSPTGVVRIMDGVHSQLARVTHTGQLAVDATVTANIADGLNVGQSGSWVLQGAHQAGQWNVAHVTSVVHVSAAVILPVKCVSGCAGSEGTGVAQSGQWTVQAAHQGGQWNVAHVTSVTHVSAAATFPVRIDGGGGVSQSGSWTIQAAHQGGSWTVAVTQGGQGLNVAHVSSVAHVAATLTDRCPKVAAVNQATGTTVITGAANLFVEICGIVLVSATAQSVSVSEGTGTVCATGAAGLLGGTTASMALAANGGISSVAGTPWLRAATAGDNVCVLQSGAGNVSGVITYRLSP